MAFLLPTMHNLRSFTKTTSLNSCLVVRSGHHYHPNATAVAPVQEIFKSLPEVTQFIHGEVRLHASILCVLTMKFPASFCTTLGTPYNHGHRNQARNKHSAHLVVSSKGKCQSWPSAERIATVTCAGESQDSDRQEAPSCRFLQSQTHEQQEFTIAVSNYSPGSNSI